MVFSQRHNLALRIRIARIQSHQHADPSHSVWLLGARRERPSHRRASEKRDELAPPHAVLPKKPQDHAIRMKT
jgi:hypothetical protein